MQRDAIILTLGQNFFKMYPGGKEEVIRVIEQINTDDNMTWWQLCGSGVPAIKVPYAYLLWDGLIQYRLDIDCYKKRESGTFYDGGIERIYRNKNMVVMQGPVIKAPFNIPHKGFQGIRYTEFLF